MNKSIALFALAGLASVASADLVFTEAYTGVSGPDGTADWVEITNTGNSSIDLADFAYEDESAVSGGQAALASMVVAAGESVIVLVGVDAGEEAAEIADFNALWSYSGQIQAVDGGGLSGGGDEVNLIDIMSQSVVAEQVTDGGLSAVFDDVNNIAFTIDFVNNGSFGALSQLGVNGAYESGVFGDPGEERTTIGSPGLVPAPSAFALLGLGGLVAGRRRR